MQNLSIEYTYTNEDAIDMELKCSICNDPFLSPVNCVECGQTFCDRCIRLWSIHDSSCPLCRRMKTIFLPVISRVVHNQLDRLPVRCSLCQEENIERSNFRAHLTIACPKRMATCPKKCGWKGLQELVEVHQSQCRKRSGSWWNIFSW